MALFRVPAPLALAASIGWEIIENAMLIPAFDWDLESETNAAADVATNMTGYAVMRSILKDE